MRCSSARDPAAAQMETRADRWAIGIRQAVSMPRRRRVALLFAVLLVLTVVAIVAPRPQPADDPTPRTSPATTGGGDVTAAVRATLPRDKIVRAKVGDLVEIAVTSTEPDSASVQEFGLTEAAARGAPARFSFLADRPGRFDVTLLLSDEPAGRIVVRP